MRQEDEQPKQGESRTVDAGCVGESLAVQRTVDRWALSSSMDADSSKTVAPTRLSEGELPNCIGRYQVQRRLGRGGFAEVYLARDQQLDRYVAIKVPRPDRFLSDQDLVDFIEEARKTAQFDHHGIVRVYDVQREADYVYIVEQYIDGADLEAYAKSHSLSSRDIAKLMIAVADAVGYAHDRGFVHRDLKPSNILMDHRGTPYVADFGLAVQRTSKDSLVGTLAGTYPYMSPEQVRGESHRLDGRSDIWSLGVILYQLLTKRLPFQGDSRQEVLTSIIDSKPPPPSLADPALAGELSRICLSCLAKRASDRFQSADELIADLRHWLSVPAGGVDPVRRQGTPDEIEETVEPQGLRTFERRHAKFFLMLLPGPHDREGLPKSVRFWKSRVESRDGNEAFSVGLMYGPSGCGKSSIVRAGILPRLSDQVLPVFVDASSHDTIERIAQKIRKACPELTNESSLVEMVGRLRQQEGSAGRKVLVVIDQFEQFLHAHNPESQEQLAIAMRQADGVGIQCLILVRDDFYGAINRFFHRLEIPLAEGHNAALVDLFDADHARMVLTAFGRALGKLPALPELPTPQQQRFVDRAVKGLKEEGKISCVRLSMFSEMMKSRPWTEQSLRELGGIEGVGFMFLQEQFSKRSSPPDHRVHEGAVRGVLRELIPAGSSQLKGPMRNHAQLLEASGYRDRPADFEVVLQILDRDLRLITPTEAVDSNHVEAAAPQAAYQLAHDYLTPAIRTWLNLRQMETRRGRAQMRLDEQAKAYAANPERRSLPSALEFLSMLLLTNRRIWTSRQKEMMRAATRLHVMHAACVVVALLVIASLAYQLRGDMKTRGLVSRLLVASPANLSGIILELDDSPRAVPVLRGCLEQAISSGQVPQQVKLRLALSRKSPEQLPYLRDALVNAEVPYGFLPLLADALLVDGSPAIAAELRDQFFHSTSYPEDVRFRVATALALNDPSAKWWTDQDWQFLAEQLIKVDPDQQALLRLCLRQCRHSLKTPLLALLRTRELSEVQQLLLARALADFCSDDVDGLCEAVCYATPEQLRFLRVPFEKMDGDACKERLLQLAEESDSADLKGRIQVGQRRAAAAIALLGRGMTEAVPMVLNVSDDPESLTQFVHGSKARQLSAANLIDCLERYVGWSRPPAGVVPELTHGRQDRVLFGLLSALGDFALEELPPDRQQMLLDQVAFWYEHHPSSGVHGIAGWLLRQWGEDEEARRIDQIPVRYEQGREWFTIKINTMPTPNLQGVQNMPETFYMTFIVFEPGTYDIGSPIEEIAGSYEEQQVSLPIERRFAILDRELTCREIKNLRWFAARYGYPEDSPEHPYGGINWYDAVRYCRWLGLQCGIAEEDQPYPAKQDLRHYPPDPARRAEGAPRNWPVHLNRRGFRMPTEAEWESACRAGTKSTWSFGDDERWIGHYAWISSNTQRAMLGRSKRPNLRGLFDMHGNRKEWCHDWRRSRREYKPGDVDQGGTNNSGDLRAVRGGGFVDWSATCRSAVRGENVPSRRPETIGLRIAMTLDDEPE